MLILCIKEMETRRIGEVKTKKGNLRWSGDDETDGPSKCSRRIGINTTVPELALISVVPYDIVLHTSINV